MNETEISLSQLFQDKPVDEVRLQSIKLNVMRYIQEHPLDFQGQLLLAARKRWGMVLLGLLAISGFVPALLIYLRGYNLSAFFENSPSLILGILPVSWLDYLWESIGLKVVILAEIKSVIELLWSNYSWYLISIPVLYVVMYRSESKTWGHIKSN